MKFIDIIGNKKIKNTLINSFKSNRVHHAYLFSGPSGIGKIQMAIAFSQFINCTEKKEDDSCGKCKSCSKYETLQHPDLHFIFPVVKTSQNNKPSSIDFIDKWKSFLNTYMYEDYDEWLNFLDVKNQQAQIFTNESQEIIRIVNLKPFEAQYKILIIYLPEKMHINAANKLLKSIEEPPLNTIFFLITEDEENVLSTIKSRTQILRFSKPDKQEIFEFLKSVNSNLSNKSIDEIVRISDGNLFKALKLAENSELQEDNQSFIDLFLEFFNQCQKKDYKEINEFLEKFNNLGREKQKQFLLFSLGIIQQSYEYHIIGNQNKFFLNDEKFLRQNILNLFRPNNIKSIYNEFQKSYNDITRNGSSKIIFFDLLLIISQIINKN